MIIKYLENLWKQSTYKNKLEKWYQKFVVKLKLSGTNESFIDVLHSPYTTNIQTDWLLLSFCCTYSDRLVGLLVSDWLFAWFTSWVLLLGMCGLDEHEHFSTLLRYESMSGWLNSCHRLFTWVFLKKKKLNFPRVKTHMAKAIRNRTQKLSTPSCLDFVEGFGSGLVTGSGQVSSLFLKNACSRSLPLVDSATFRMALDTSATRGDPIGKTCQKMGAFSLESATQRSF